MADETVALGKRLKLLDKRLKTFEKKEEWAWRVDGSASGPFDSRQEAIDDALTSANLTPIKLGRVHHVFPEDYVDKYLADSIVEAMDNNLPEHVFDEEVFVTNDLCRETLLDLVRAWAREHVETNADWYMIDEETIELR